MKVTLIVGLLLLAGCANHYPDTGSFTDGDGAAGSGGDGLLAPGVHQHDDAQLDAAEADADVDAGTDVLEQDAAPVEVADAGTQDSDAAVIMPTDDAAVPVPTNVCGGMNDKLACPYPWTSCTLGKKCFTVDPAVPEFLRGCPAGCTMVDDTQNLFTCGADHETLACLGCKC